MDEARELEALLRRIAEEESGCHPTELSPAYLAALEEIEGLECNRPGQDKSWILRALRNSRELFRGAARLD